MAQLMLLPLTVSCFSKIQIGFAFLVPAHLGSPGQRAVKRMYDVWLVMFKTYPGEFVKVRWLHITGVVDKVVVAYFQLCCGFYMTKIVKIGSFLTELLTMKMPMSWLV